MEKQEAIVLYPSPPIGHLVSMVELGKLILSQNPSLSIHIILVPPPYQPESTTTYISSVSSSFPSITFHRLPTVTPYSSTTSQSHEALILEIICFSNPNVHRTLFSISQTFNLRAMIIDFFCTAVLDIVAGDFTFPVYYFFTSGAACLASFFHLPTLDETTTGKNLKDVHTLFNIPGVPPIKGSDMPTRFALPVIQTDHLETPSSSNRPCDTFGSTLTLYSSSSNGVCIEVLDRNDEVYDAFISFSKQLSHSSGIIINTFEALENRSIKAITEELCFRNIYPIGPLIVKTRTGVNKNANSCLNWLDSQPEQSVVFLCFGSLGLFSQEQLKEIAIAIGGFVTHCGWNSILEAVCAGVPMVAWPLYAEQRFNRAVIVEEIKIAISMNKTETGFVSSMEVEKRVREVVEEGPVRERTKAMKNAAESALVETGSSRHALTALLESWSPKQT
ncbi:hypothetical protein DY000_02050372 [Brassica cretica]|uniref:Glycosyltransferase n=1 Tax=Brassica cretica TaxID=69181 RepID=A0ABQ7F0V2_BRACR|nr:hypothetical protein DY000_02050372 [Brassica cretica]